jgi:DNA-binding response OmpR family regulator
VGAQSGRRILVLGDSELLFNVIEANLRQSRLRIDRFELRKRNPASQRARVSGSFDLIIVASSSPTSEPVVSLSKAALTEHIGHTPILIISDREFEADHEGLIYHLDFPFEPDALRNLVLALLDRTETKRGSR